MPAEGTRDVVILAVNVVGNCSTQGYIFGSRRDGKEKPAGDGEVEDLREGDAGLSSKQARFGIKVDQAVHPGRLQQVAVFEEADVAVAAAHADGERAVVEAGGDRQESRFASGAG